MLDGRDIGTVIFPDADVKIFVTATPEAARSAVPRSSARRQNLSHLSEVLADILRRDERDSLARLLRSRPRRDAALARYHAFGYRRCVPGRRRLSSKPSEQAGSAVDRVSVMEDRLLRRFT